MSIGIVGFGRFGRALAGLLSDAGVAYRAFDAAAEVPAAVRAESLAELAASASTIVVAVPVPAIRDALVALAPHVGPSHLVLDVGSVKVAPVAALDEVLGARVPWVGTHPLFGPTSLARAERPLRVVICPSDRHPTATARARAFYEALGCEVGEQTPEAHDRAMAGTHVLAFFLAKGLLDAGAGEEVLYAPPSFQAIARTIDAVRGDAGHLFAAIQRENPYAQEARTRLLAALGDIDRRVAEPPSSTPRDVELSIPDLGARTPALRETRELIDELDRDLVALLARRVELARRAGEAKAALGLPILDEQRERTLLADRATWATQAGLSTDETKDVFNAILRLSRRAQERT